jgi:hypothetical protein
MNVRNLCWHGCLILGVLSAAHSQAQERSVGQLQIAQPVPAQQTERPQEQFVGVFSNGVKVEFVGLAEHPSAKGEWWRPNGTPLDERPYDRINASMGAGLGQQAFEACWRWHNLGDADIQTGYQILPSTGGGADVPGKKSGTPAETLDKIAFIFNTSQQKTCNIRFTISTPATEWTTTIDKQAGHSGSTGKFDPVIGMVGASFLPQHRDGTDTIVAISYRIPDREVRLVGVDSEGKEHVSDTAIGGGFSETTLQEFRFKNLMPEQIEHWRLQTRIRKTEFIEFQHVSLSKDQETPVRMVHAQVPPQTPLAPPGTAIAPNGAVFAAPQAMVMPGQAVPTPTPATPGTAPPAMVYSAPTGTLLVGPQPMITFADPNAMPQPAAAMPVPTVPGMAQPAIPENAAVFVPAPQTINQATLSFAYAPTPVDQTALIKRREELHKTLADKHGYKLEKGQPLKYMSDADNPERNELHSSVMGSFYAGGMSQPGQAQETFEPFMMIFQQDSHGTFRWSQEHQGIITLDQVLETILDLKKHQLDCQPGLLMTYMPGDWILSWDPQQPHEWSDADLAAFEKILNEEKDLGVKIAWKEVEKPALVVSGKYKATPMTLEPMSPESAAQVDGVFQIGVQRGGISMQVGTHAEMLQAIGESLMLPVVDEATERAKKPQFIWRFEGFKPSGTERLKSDEEIGVLEALHAQLGYDFKIEPRKVKLLSIQPVEP